MYGKSAFLLMNHWMLKIDQRRLYCKNLESKQNVCFKPNNKRLYVFK